MKSLASHVLLLAVTATAAAQEPPAGDGPRGSSQLVAGEVRYDAVGYAVPGDLTGVTGVSVDVPAGSYAEVTALDSGKTILMAIVAGTPAPGRILATSPAAAAALGMTGDAFAVRVRRVTPTPQDIVRLREGQAASFRAEAPPALLVALRRKIAALPPAPKRPARPVTRQPESVVKRPGAPAPVVQSGLYVQVAALSSPDRAASIAKAVGGTVLAGPPLWRVRLGPFPNGATAARAAAGAARAGYPGAQITRIP